MIRATVTALVVFAATTAPLAVATAQQTPSPAPLAFPQPVPPKANLPDATAPPGVVDLCQPPGPATRVRLFALQQLARTRFLARFTVDDRNFAGAALALDRGRIVDASALVLDRTTISGSGGVFLAHLGVRPGRHDLAVHGWEYVSAPPSCWKHVDVTFRNVLFAPAPSAR